MKRIPDRSPRCSYGEAGHIVGASIRESFVYLFLVSLPIQLGTYFFFPFSFIDGIRIDYLALSLYATDFIVLTLALLYFDVLLTWIRKHWQILSLLIVLLIFNALFAYNPIVSLFRIWKIVELLIIYGVVRHVRLEKIKVIISLSISALFVSLLAVLQFLEQSSLQGFWYFLGERYISPSMPGIAKINFFGKQILRPYSLFSHPNSMGGFYLLVYTYTLTSISKLRPVLSIFTYLVLILSAIIVLLSFSKIAIFMLVFISLYYRLVIKKSLCKLCKIASIFSFGIIAVMFLSAEGDPFSITKRVSALQIAFSTLLKYPLWGVGLGNSVYFMTSIPYLFSLYQPVHNVFVLLLVEMGLFTGIPLFIGLLRFAQRHMSTVAVFCTLVLITTGSFDHYWITLQQNWLLIPTIFALITNPYLKARTRLDKTTAR